jgi:hypothetical protein
MEDSKIIRLLKSLDASEMRLFNKYLRSPFFNYSAAVLSLYEHLRRYYPSFSSPDLERSRVYNKIFPGQAYNDKKFRNLLHEFLNHIEHFMVQQQLRKNEYLSKKLLMEAQAERDLYPLFVQRNQELIEDMETQSFRDISTYRELTDLYEQYYFHPSTDKVKDGETALRSIQYNLDRYYMADKLRLANEAASREKIVPQKLPISFMEPILEAAGELGAQAPLLSFYAALYRLNQTGEEALFQELKQQLMTHAGELSFTDRQGGLLQLLNYSIRKGNSGDAAYSQEAFDLYWYGLEEKLLFENGKLTDATFTNIAFLGGKVGALDQVEVFIRENAQYLEEHIRADAETLALSLLYYQRMEYEKVDDLIGNAVFASTFYQLRARSILVRALFELFLLDESYYELMIARMEAFEKYLRRKDISDAQRDPYLGLLKFLKKMAKLIMRRSFYGEEVQKLEQRVETNKMTSNRDWLLEQIKKAAKQ